MRFFLVFVLISLVNGIGAENLRLWYSNPAKNWWEALPVGNSHIGAMVYGGIDHEEIQLNEETFWSGSPYNNDKSGASRYLGDVRELIFQGRNAEARKLLDENFFTGNHGMRYLTLGSLLIDFSGVDNVKNYYRELSLDDATAVTGFTVDGIKYKRTVFSSFSGNVVVIDIHSDSNKIHDFELKYTCPLAFAVDNVGKDLIVKCSGVEHEGVKPALDAVVGIRVITDGKSTSEKGKIRVSDASRATVYVSAATNFVNYKDVSGDAMNKVIAFLDESSSKEYATLLSEHVDKYKEQFDRVTFTLPASAQAVKETDVRITEFGKKDDPTLPVLLFQYGRYLLISSSQPGSQPANLQGIWNKEVYAPWDSKYTININAEMNYWPAEVTNLAETHYPLFEMIKDLSETGRKTAKTLYGANGWVAHHNTDIWRIAGPVDFADAGVWPNGGAWLTQHLWQHYLFTGDKDFLRDYYPVMKGAADFLLSFLVKHPDYGWMVTVPSVSPEHGPGGVSITAGCTMDNQIAFDVLENTRQAAEILGESGDYIDSLKNMAAMLPPMKIGRYNQLQEWLEDVDDPNDKHRHISHLYGLYPSNQISPYADPFLFQKAKNTLLQRGDMATGWSIGWKINFWARMLDGNHAYRIIKNMLNILPNDNVVKDYPEGRTYPNMFDAHPPFQIDGNFGFTAGIAEMLLQSHDGAVHILPALPDEWQEGKVTGLVARGGFEIDMEWKQGNVEKIVVHSRIGGTIRLRSYVPLEGKGLKKAKGECPNSFYARADVRKPVISEELTSPEKPELRNVYEYDLKTVAGKDYVITNK